MPRRTTLMSVIITVDVPAEDFTLGAALAANPGVRVRLERVVPMGGTFSPYFWAADHTLEDLESALGAATDVESFTVVDTMDGEALVRVEWGSEADGLLDAVADSGAVILEATGEADSWTMQLRFDDNDALTGFYRRCVAEGISLDVTSVHEPGAPEDLGLGLELTDEQYETLAVALEAGYFEVPRRINLVDLADRLGVSDTAVSQRLRRGIQTLLESALSTGKGARDADDG